MNDLTKILVKRQKSLRDSIKIMDQGGIGCIVVINDDHSIHGILTDGDFRRNIINGISLDSKIQDVCNKDYLSVSYPYRRAKIEKLFKNPKLQHIPITDNNKIIDIIQKDDFYENKDHTPKQTINLPIVIMAGGKGSRLDPFTRILPKPLIPIGNKTILEIIIEKFLAYHVNEFYLSVNYKSIVIKSYFEELKPPYKLEYINEDKPLGTAGSLKYLEGRFNSPLIVTNCDILIDTDYNEIINHHNANNNVITIVTSLKSFNIPYGVCKTENGGKLKEIIEKPEYSFLINTGMYIINSEVLSVIPSEKLFHFTHLINKIQKSKGKVGIYPISDRSWIDTGEWDEYKKNSLILSLPKVQ